MSDDRRFEEQARGALERAAATLDAATVARLRAARTGALAAMAPRPAAWRYAFGAAVAMAALAAVTVATLYWRAPEPPPAQIAAGEDLELLATESPELLKELEFFRWLAAQQTDAG